MVTLVFCTFYDSTPKWSTNSRWDIEINDAPQGCLGLLQAHPPHLAAGTPRKVMGEILGGRPKVKVDIQVTCSCSTMFISNIFWWIWCHESHSHLPWVESFLLQKLFILHLFIKSSALQMSSKKMVKDQGLSLDFSTWRRPEVSHSSLQLWVYWLKHLVFRLTLDVEQKVETQTCYEERRHLMAFWCFLEHCCLNTLIKGQNK